MKFGFFDDSRKEYVITNPRTPYPWINYLGTGDFFSIVSNTGGGYSFYKDARLRRITRIRYNNVPLDDGGKYFYINDSGTLWSPGWKPVKKMPDSYECRHGIGYTLIRSELNNLQAEVLYFVPMGFDGEVIRLRLKNNGNSPRPLKIHSFAEWALWDAQDDSTNFQRNFSTGEVEVEGSCIYHKTEYRERRNHYAFYSVNTPLSGFDTDRETFLGLYNGFDLPDMVTNGCSGDSVAHGWSPVASHFIETELLPGEEKDFIFILGYVENDPENKFIAPGVINKAGAYEMMDRFASSQQVDEALDQLKAFYGEMMEKLQVTTGDDKLDRMVNVWNQYQCLITYFFSRSTSYFESGIGRGMGFRDSNQDIAGMVHLNPQWARQRILELASTQLPDGSAYHQYQPLTRKGNHDIGGNFNDDPLWLIFSVSAYLRETGDWSLLEAEAPFDNNGNEASVFEHIKRSFYHVVNHLGPHNLPLIGRADWNDCLNLNCFSDQPGEPFQTTANKSGNTAESIMIAGMFVLYGAEFVTICELTGRNQEAINAQIEIDKMKYAIDAHGWDGNWFLRAYDYYGNKVGSHENEEGKIFIESQGFCIMAGIGLDDGRAKLALQSVGERLATPYGIVLVNPAYTRYQLHLGEISSYPPGYKENAGIFCHNNPWIIIAETMAGNNDLAFDYYRRITPAYLEDISDLHKTEPYVYSQMIAGKDAARPGEAKNSWLTGTAAWTYYAVSQYILGIRPDYKGLTINPCLPSSIREFSAIRKFRGNNYHITVKNMGGNHVSCLVNGKPWSGPLPCDSTDVDYDVLIILNN